MSIMMCDAVRLNARKRLLRGVREISEGRSRRLCSIVSRVNIDLVKRVLRTRSLLLSPHASVADYH